MKRLFFFVIVFLSGCNFSTERIMIYTVDMEYACECTSYRIFRANALNESSKMEKPYNISMIKEDINKAYNVTLTKEDNFSLSGGHSLSGVEVSLVFHDKKLKTNFEKTEPYYGRCYIYYFEGRFSHNRLKIDDDGDQLNEFIVDNYKFILQSPDCIKNIYPK